MAVGRRVQKNSLAAAPILVYQGACGAESQRVATSYFDSDDACGTDSTGYAAHWYGQEDTTYFILVRGRLNSDEGDFSVSSLRECPGD